ncbi:hypothetical protein STEG23_001437, partial [Scotinomys teguina]
CKLSDVSAAIPCSTIMLPNPPNRKLNEILSFMSCLLYHSNRKETETSSSVSFGLSSVPYLW